MAGERRTIWSQHSRWLAPAAGAGAYALAWCVLWSASRSIWFLPAGLRLGALWVTPQRYWIWLAVAEWVGLSVFGLPFGFEPYEMHSVAMNTVPWMLYAGAVALLRDGDPPGVPATPASMVRLLGAGMLAASLVSPLLSLVLPMPDDSPVSGLGPFNYLLGDVVGQVMLAPLLILLAQYRLRWPRGRELLRDVALVLLPVVALMAVAMLRFQELASVGYLVASAPLLYLGFRHGWVGPALGVPLVGVALELVVRLEPGVLQYAAPQVGLAAIGAGALVLGASTTALRASHWLLAQRNAELSESNRSLQALASQMREMSQRLTRLQEQGQRELAAELHDELGQAVTALATRVSLGLRQAHDGEQRMLLESLRDQAANVHESLRRVLRQLRPAVLDAYGLQRALSEGPPRELLEDARIEYRPRFVGDVDALDEDATTAIYRICQEAVTNCVRHAHAQSLSLHLEVVREPQRRRCRVRLDIRDDGIGVCRRPVAGAFGLAGIRHRVLALDGEYEFTTGPDGTRHVVEFVRPLD